MRSRDGVTFRARDGVTSRDGVTRWRCYGVTSDVIGRLAPEFSVWKLVLGIKNLAPAQDVDLPLPYPQLEHLVGVDRGVDYGGPRSDLKLAFWRAIDGQSAAIAY